MHRGSFVIQRPGESPPPGVGPSGVKVIAPVVPVTIEVERVVVLPG